MFAIALCALAGRSASAAQYTELNNPGVFNWNAAPWSAGIPNGLNDGVLSSVSGLMRGGGIVTIDATSTGTTPSSLMVGWQGNSTLNITGGSLTVGDSGGEGFAIGESGIGTVTQSGASVVTATALRFARGGGSLGTYNFDGGILNAGFIGKGGGGGSIFNLNGGTLKPIASNNNWIAAGVTIQVKAGGAIFDTAGLDVTVNSAIVDDGTTSNGGLRKLGSPTTTTGVLRLGAVNTYTGDTNIDQGYLVTNVSSALSPFSVVKFNSVGGAVSKLDLVSTNQKVAGLASTATTGATVEIYSGGNAGSLEVATATGQTYNYSGQITGNATTFTKSGAGTQILGGNNLYGGLTTVSAGTLQIGDNNANGNVGAGSYAVAAGAKLVFSRNTDNALFTNQSFSGAGDVEFTGQSTGYFTFRNGQYTGTMFQTGKTIVNYAPAVAGTLWYQRALWLEKDGVISHGSLLDLQAGKVILRDQATNGISVGGLSGNAGTFITTDQGVEQKITSVVLAGGDYVFNGVIGKDAFGELNNNLAFTKAGPGKQTLAGSNTYTGITRVNEGTLVLGHATNTLADAGAVTINAGTLALGENSDTVGVVTLNGGGITSTTGVLTGTSYAVNSGVISARLAGPGTLTKNGVESVTLSGANTYTGATTVNSGRLNIAGSVTSNVMVAPGAGSALGGEGSISGGLTFLGNAQLFFDPTTPAALNANTVSATGATVTLALAVTAPAATGIVVLNAPGGITGTAGVGGNFQFTGRGTTYLNAGNTQLLFDYAPANLKWKGNVAGSPTFWNLNTTANFVSGANPEKFFTGDTVLFDDTASSFTVAIQGTSVQPASVTFDHSTTYTLQGGAIAGATGLIKSGPGALVVRNANSYSGGTTINAGKIQLTTSGNLGSGPIVNNAVLECTTSTVTLGNVISGTGSVSVIGGGTLILTGANTYSGGTTITFGIIQVGDGTSSGSLGTGPVVNNGSVVVSGSAETVLANNISGPGALRTSFPASLTLSGTNTYTGGTFIPSGSVTVQGGSALSDTGEVNLSGARGVSLILNSSETIGNLTGGTGLVHLNGNTLTFGGAGFDDFTPQISGLGNVIKKGAGTHVFDQEQLYTGLTTVNEGALQIGRNDPSTFIGNGSYVIAAGARLIFSHNAVNGAAFINQSVSGAGDLVFNGGSTGYFTLRTNYTGALSLTGKVIVNYDAPVAGTTWFQRALWLEKNNVMSNAAVLELQSGKVVLRDQESTGIVVSGLTGVAGTYITTDRGSVQKFTTNIAAGNTFVFNGVIGKDMGFAELNDNLAFTKSGAGTQVLEGANTYTGPTTVNEGKLLINGSLSGVSGVSVANGAALGGDGSVGAVTVAGGGSIIPGDSISPSNGVGTFSATALTLGGTSVLDFQLGAPNQPGGSGSDFINVGGPLTLDGLLHVTPQAGFAAGSYDLFLYGGALTDNGLQLEPAFLSLYPGSTVTASSGEVTLQVVPEPGAVLALLGGLGVLAGLRRRPRA